jgi:hypothetical protein
VLGVAFLAIGAVLFTGIPAQAAPPWPTAGYTPTCNAVIREASDWHYYDTTKPTIVSFAAPKYIALDATSRSHAFFTTRVKDACSGVGSVQWGYVYTGTFSTLGAVLVSGDQFDGTYRYSENDALSTLALGPLPSVVAYAYDRFSDFTLALDHKSLLTSTARVADATTIASRELPASAVTYIVRKTYATRATASATLVTKGRHVVLGSHFTFATLTTPGKLTGVKVRVQRRYSGGNWSYISSSLTTSSTGLAAFSINPTKTASYRFIYAGKFAAPWNAPVTSLTVSVRVH